MSVAVFSLEFEFWVLHPLKLDVLVLVLDLDLVVRVLWFDGLW